MNIFSSIIKTSFVFSVMLQSVIAAEFKTPDLTAEKPVANQGPTNCKSLNPCRDLSRIPRPYVKQHTDNGGGSGGPGNNPPPSGDPWRKNKFEPNLNNRNFKQNNKTRSQ